MLSVIQTMRTMRRRIILASSSPRRRILLKQIGMHFEVIPAQFAETVDPAAEPGDTVESLALQKAEIVDNQENPRLARPGTGQSEKKRAESQESHQESGRTEPSAEPILVIGADTIVVRDGDILGKPADSAEAKQMLRSLSDRTHQVYTGVALIHYGKNTQVQRRLFHERTDVPFGNLSDDEISAYVKGGSPMDKAGAYGIQDDLGALFVKKIDGDYYNVVGFPLFRFYKEVNKLVPGLVTPFQQVAGKEL